MSKPAAQLLPLHDRRPSGAPDTEEGYLYFVAIPDGGGAHAFAKTYAGHQKNLEKYGYT